MFSTGLARGSGCSGSRFRSEDGAAFMVTIAVDWGRRESGSERNNDAMVRSPTQDSASSQNGKNGRLERCSLRHSEPRTRSDGPCPFLRGRRAYLRVRRRWERKLSAKVIGQRVGGRLCHSDVLTKMAIDVALRGWKGRIIPFVRER